MSTQVFPGHTSDVVQFGTILILGIGVGVTSAMYSPLISVGATFLFTLLAIMLYVNSVTLKPRSIETISEQSQLVAVKSRTLSFLVALSFFLSITIPKSGKTISSIPITTANVCILFTLLYWIFHVFSSSPHIIFQVPAAKPIFLFVLYSIMAVLIGAIYHNSPKSILLEFVAFVGFIPVYFLICTSVRTKTHLNILLGLIVIGLILVCGYGVLQRVIGFERIAIPGITEQYNLIQYAKFGGRWNWVVGGERKLYSTFQNGNIFGNHLATFIPFLGGILFSLRSFWKKIILGGVFILAWYALIFSYSRGALVGTLSGFLFLALISKRTRLKTIIVTCIIICSLLVMWKYVADRPEFARYDFQKITTNPDQFSAGRVSRALSVLKGYTDIPLHSQLFGLGFGGVLRSSYQRIDYVDNLYLTLLYKTGAVGLGILCIVFVKFFWKLLKLRNKTDDIRTKALINGGIAGLVSSLVHNIADILWFFPPLAVNFWFLAGITMMIAVIGTRETSSESTKQ